MRSRWETDDRKGRMPMAFTLHISRLMAALRTVHAVCRTAFKNPRSGSARPLRVLLSTVFLLQFALVSPSSAEDEKVDVLNVLADEPVTMFDWGLDRLDQDIKSVAYYLAAHDPERDPPIAGTLYSWRDKKIEAYISIHEPTRNRDEARCREVFEIAVDTLTNGSPGGPDKASWYLDTLFVPKGRPWARPVHNLGERLVEVVNFEVILRATSRDELAGDSLRVRCTGAMNAHGDEIVAVRTGQGS